ncbi:carboxypeptidase-like regulatory domain-containing protein [Nonlabens xiamenensis]|uniref:carboxypeptidase-like regulatory domain-containing protein n=1 Tax=Nonlabens xiamenensis TaxID=2341043 RepID=UPI000F6097B6|nr:carboxypeptidase-like regulatory domain-containing protein [Nonlabens xiamenensis]
MCDTCNELVQGTAVKGSYGYSLDVVKPPMDQQYQDDYDNHPAPGSAFDALLNNAQGFLNPQGSLDGVKPFDQSASYILPYDPVSVGSLVDNQFTASLGPDKPMQTAFGITGTIVDSEGDPVSGATVYVDESNYAMSDFEGNFIIPNIAAPIQAVIQYQGSKLKQTLNPENLIKLGADALDQITITAKKRKFPWLWVGAGASALALTLYAVSDKPVKAKI